MMKKLLASVSLLVLGFQAHFSYAATGCSSNTSGGTTPLPQILPAPVTLSLSASDPLNSGDLQYDEVPGLLKKTVCSKTDCTVDSKAYVLINVITWRSGPVADSQWYIYRGGGGKWSNDDFRNNARVYGAKSTYLLSLQVTLGVVITTPPAYAIQEDKRIPQNLQNFTALLRSIAPGKTGGGKLPGEGQGEQAPQPTVYWTGKQLTRTNAGGADVCIATAVMQPGISVTTDAPNKDAPSANAQSVAAPPGKSTSITLTGTDPNGSTPSRSM
jgi:hypothetical protein